MAREDAPPSVFVDSNVLFSAAHSPLGAPSKLLALHGDGRINVVISRQVLEELVRNLRRKAPRAIPVLLTLFQIRLPRLAEDPYEDEVDTLTQAGVNKDDAPIVAAAHGADVDYFVTGDRPLREEVRALNPPFRVLSPREFLSLMTSD